MPHGNRNHPLPRAARRTLAGLLALGMLLITLPSPAALADAPTNTFTGSAAVAPGFEFRPTGSMATARYEHTATLLPDGRVLVAGGWNGTNGLGSAEIYDPTTGTWSATGSMGAARISHTATLLPDGRVLVGGGHSGASLSSAELYNPSTATWSATGSMSTARRSHTATLLPDGRVLVVGGNTSGAELYDPASGTWSATGSMNASRLWHTATLLADGRVLAAGGCGGSSGPALSSAEIYDPATSTWNATGSMGTARCYCTATLLPDGRVLVAGGENISGNGGILLSSAEVYDPATGTWNGTTAMGTAREWHTATLLTDGRVLVAGGTVSGPISSAEIYNPPTGTWSGTIATVDTARTAHTATLLPNGRVLVAGGSNGATEVDSAELGIPILANRFTGTLTLPAGWVNSASIMVGIAASTSGAAPNAAALSNDGATWGSWLALSGTPPSAGTTWDVGGDGADRPVSLRLRDVNGQVAVVVTGTVSVDTALPSSSMAALPATSPSAIPLAWSGSDALSGVRAYTVEVRAAGGAWTSVVADTPATSTTYSGVNGTRYDFRVRAADQAGNLEAWPSGYDATTIVDTGAPTGTLTINGGAAATNSPAVSLALSANDALGTVTSMRFSDDGSSWDAWQAYATAADYSLPGVDGPKSVYVQFRDEAGNISTPASDSIILDRVVPTGTVMIEGGAAYATDPTVALTPSASDSGSGVADMRFQVDGGAWGAWQPYTGSASATLSGQGAHTVYAQYRDQAGNASAVVSDGIVLDTVAPVSSMTSLPATSPSTFSLSWSGSDTTSGVSGYDLQVRQGSSGTWTDVMTGTSATGITYAGVNGTAYYFRERASDVAGNVEDWPADYDTMTVVDTGAPTGTLVINGGAAATNSPAVSLALSADDALGSVTSMRFGDDGTTWDPWQAYATTAAYSLPGADGPKSVYVQFRDEAGNLSTPVSAAITLDTAAGAEYQVTINQGALYTNQVTVTLTIGARPYTARMQVSNDAGFAGAAVEAFTSRREWQITQYGAYVIPRIVYVRYRDAGGNVLDTKSDDIILDVTAPIGGVEAEAGPSGSSLMTLSLSSAPDAIAEAASPPNVTLHMSATDDVSGVGGMLISSRADFQGASWEPYATTRDWYAPEGTTTVRVKFRDNAGNVSVVYTDTVTIDTIPPTGGRVTINGGATYATTRTVTLGLSATDSGSGVSQMMVSNASTFGGAAWQPFTTAMTWTLSAGEGDKAVYSRFRDSAGNISSVCSDTITVDTLPPTGSVRIDSGAAYAASTSITVTLSLSATDRGAGVGQMMISNESGLPGAAWQTFVTSLPWALPAGVGTRTVYAVFQDRAGNVSAVYSDTTTLHARTYLPVILKTP